MTSFRAAFVTDAGGDALGDAVAPMDVLVLYGKNPTKLAGPAEISI